jgi:hypothetical protein
VGPRRG